MLKRVAVQLNRIRAQSSYAVLKRGHNRIFYIFNVQRIELKQPAAADYSARHADHRIFGCRAYETYYSLFKRRKDAVRLRLAPPMAFVKQQIRS